jgi:hypothetical protein
MRFSGSMPKWHPCSTENSTVGSRAGSRQRQAKVEVKELLKIKVGAIIIKKCINHDKYREEGN